jgi:hypothetical protein
MSNEKTKSCRTLIYDGIYEAANRPDRRYPRADLEEAVHKLTMAVDLAIEGDSLLREVFSQSLDTALADYQHGASLAEHGIGWQELSEDWSGVLKNEHVMRGYWEARRKQEE